MPIFMSTLIITTRHIPKENQHFVNTIFERQLMPANIVKRTDYALFDPVKTTLFLPDRYIQKASARVVMLKIIWR